MLLTRMYCNGCGRKLDESRAGRDLDGRTKLHADIAHPIHGPAREQIQNAIVHAFISECERAKQPGYVCRYDEHDARFHLLAQVVHQSAQIASSEALDSAHEHVHGADLLRLRAGLYTTT